AARLDTGVYATRGKHSAFRKHRKISTQLGAPLVVIGIVSSHTLHPHPLSASMGAAGGVSIVIESGEIGSHAIRELTGCVTGIRCADRREHVLEQRCSMVAVTRTHDGVPGDDSQLSQW